MEIWILFADGENYKNPCAFKTYDDTINYLVEDIHELFNKSDWDNVIATMMGEIAEGCWQCGDTIYYLKKTNVIGG